MGKASSDINQLVLSQKTFFPTFLCKSSYSALMISGVRTNGHVSTIAALFNGVSVGYVLMTSSVHVS